MNKINGQMHRRGLNVTILFLALTPWMCLGQGAEWERQTEQGIKFRESGQLAEAEKFLLLALAEARKFVPEDSRLATSQNNLGACYYA